MYFLSWRDWTTLFCSVTQGLYPHSNNTFFPQDLSTFRSRDIRIKTLPIDLMFSTHLGISTEMSVKFQSDTLIKTLNLVASRRLTVSRLEAQKWAIQRLIWKAICSLECKLQRQCDRGAYPNEAIHYTCLHQSNIPGKLQLVSLWKLHGKSHVM